jgi:CubicO group peptidase (beta-lactamase class C family)
MPAPPHLRRRDILHWLGATGAVAASTACGGGGAPNGGGAPDGGGGDDGEAIARSLAEITPANQAATFRNVDRIASTRHIARGGMAVSALPAHTRSLLALRYSHGGQTHTPQDYMQRWRGGGLLVLKNGAIALELYGMGNDAASRWTSFSVAKSLTATLLGAALHEGRLALDDMVTAHVPALAGRAYAANTLRQLLRMCSGVRWDESYSSPDSDIARLGAAVTAGTPGAVLALVQQLPRVAAPGAAWNYSSGDSYVLGAAVAAACGQSLCGYLSERIWSRLGMQADAYWLLDAPGGTELGGGAFSATLRDYGRLGLFVLHDGLIGTDRVLPAGWRNTAGRPADALTAPGALISGYPLGYGYQWWSLPSSAAFTGQGIYGQFLYIDPAEDLVGVVWGAWNTPNDGAAELETYALMAAAAAALR